MQVEPTVVRFSKAFIILFEMAIPLGSTEPERVDKSENRARMSGRYFLDAHM